MAISLNLLNLNTIVSPKGTFMVIFVILISLAKNVIKIDYISYG